MSAFTDRLYSQWTARNRGGMGAVAPMVTHRPPARTDFAGVAVMRPRLSSRPDKPVSFTHK